eukprot:m.49395 g.49395  ORF g.49395 m.49395 type:complete len:65 (+) comp11090_c0_seq2:186-380(+)
MITLKLLPLDVYVLLLRFLEKNGGKLEKKKINFTPSNGNCLGIAISEADILQLASTSPPKVSAT